MERESVTSTWPGLSLAGLDEIHDQVRQNGEKLAALERILRERSDPPPPPSEEPPSDDAPPRESLH